MCSFPPCVSCRRDWADHHGDDGCPRYRRRWTAGDWWFAADLLTAAAWQVLARRR